LVVRHPPPSSSATLPTTTTGGAPPTAADDTRAAAADDIRVAARTVGRGGARDASVGGAADADPVFGVVQRPTTSASRAPPRPTVRATTLVVRRRTWELSSAAPPATGVGGRG